MPLAATARPAETLVVIAAAVVEDRAVVAAVDHAVAAESIPAVAANCDCFAFLLNGPEFRGRFLLVRVPFYCATLVEGSRRRLEQLRPKFLK